MLVHFLLAGATFVSFIWYLQPDFAEGVMNGKAFPLAIVRYFVNVAFVVSHLVNGLRHRTLYLAQVIGQRGSRIDAPR